MWKLELCMAKLAYPRIERQTLAMIFFGFGFRVEGLGFRVSGLGFRVQFARYKDKDEGLWFWCLLLRV